MSDLPLQMLHALTEFAEQQWGMFTAEQARSHGCSEAILADLVQWQILERSPTASGTYRVRAGARHPFPRTYAAWLRFRPGLAPAERLTPLAGVLSHATAARLYEFGPFPGPLLEVTLPGLAQGDASGEEAVIHPAVLVNQEWQIVHGMLVTTPARILADLVDTGLLDVDDLTALLTRALDRHLLAREDLTPYTAGRPLLTAVAASAAATTL
jgi:hypothetical protein